MKKFLQLVVFFNLFSGIWAQTPKENQEKFNWYYTPWIDSINQNNLDSQTFQIFNQGKTGWMDVNYGILCPPTFAFVQQPRRFNSTYYDEIWLTWVSDGKKWGLYQRQYQNTLDTQLIIDCNYDSITIAKNTEDELHVKTWKGKKFRVFNVLNKQWEEPTPLLKSQIFQSPGTYEIDFDPPNQIQDKNVGMEAEGDYDIASVEEGNYNGAASGPGEIYNPNRNSKLKGKIIKLIIDSNLYKYGLYWVKKDSFIIKPIYKKIERNNANTYLCYLFNSNNHFIVHDSNGIPLTPILTEIDPHRVPLFNIVKGLSGMEFIYNKQMQLLYPDSFLRINNGPTVPFANVTNRDFSMQLFDYNKLVLLPEKYDAIFLGSNLPLLIAEQKGNLIIRNYEENKTIKVKKARFTYYCKDSTLVIRKKNKSYLMNIRSGEVAKKGWDSIQTTAIPFKNRELSIEHQNRLRDVFIMYDKGKMGLINHHNNVLLNAEYETALAANYKFPGLLTFVKNKQYTLFNALEYRILVTDIDSLRYLNYAHNYRGNSIRSKNSYRQKSELYLLSFRRNLKWGILFSDDSVFIPPIYDSISIRNERLFLVKNQRYHFLGANFNFRNDFGYDSVKCIESNYLILKKQGRYYFMNTKNELFPESGAVNVRRIYQPYTYPIYVYKQQNLYGLIKTAYYQTPALLEDLRHGNNRLIWAKIDGKWGIIEQ